VLKTAQNPWRGAFEILTVIDENLAMELYASHWRARIGLKEMVRALAVFILLLQTTDLFAADFYSGRFRRVGVGAYVNIVGPITKGDSDKFKRVVLRLLSAGLKVVHVRTYSPGGDVAEALSIGRQIRLMKAQTDSPFKGKATPGSVCIVGAETEIPVKFFYYRNEDGDGSANCTCTSACFLIWAAGVGRYGEIIGVHRPAFSDQSWFGSLPKEQARVVYEHIIEEARAYLVEMGIPENVITLMFSVSSSEMRFLDVNQIAQLQNYPSYGAELFTARCGARPSKLTSPDLFMAWSDCFGRNDKFAEFYEGAENYARQYGK